MAVVRSRKTTRSSRKAVKIRHLTVQRSVMIKALVDYRPAMDTRFRCMVCGSVASELGQCCGEEMRKSMLSR